MRHQLVFTEDNHETGCLTFRDTWLTRKVKSRGSVVSILPWFATERRAVEDFIRNVYADALAIMQRNLLDNAIKYTAPGGQITISLAMDGQSPLLTVCDTGPGIPDAEKSRVTARFYRMSQSGPSGSGLGLSMAKWVAERHGADMVLADNNPKGLCVKVLFPAIAGQNTEPSARKIA